MSTTHPPLGWAVVGTGDVSRAIAADLRLLGAARLVAVASRSVERAQQFATEYGIDRGYGTIDELLADAEVDVVYIGTPHAMHADIAVRALEAAKHVLIEKPLGITADEVERVADAARSAQRFAMEGMWMKFSPAYRAALERARSGAIGKLTTVRAYFGLPFDEPEATRWSRELASSTLLDQGVYPVTLACDLFGEPVSIEASATLRHDGVDLSDHATLRFAGGRVAQVAASMVGYLEPSASINGTGGWLSLPAPFWAADQLSTHSGSLGEALMQPHTVSFPREGNGYVPMLRAVGEAIASGALEHPLHPLSSSLAIARVLDRIRAATVATPQFMETAR